MPGARTNSLCPMKSVRLSVIAFAVFLLLCGAHTLSRAGESNAPAALTLSSPVDFQVFQRASRAEGRMTLAGELLKEIDGVAVTALETRLTGAGLRTEPEWRKLA